jgi:RNA polymerase sigma-70 factor (ECF subfamily)
VDDEPLVAEYIRARDPELFRVLVERHQARVFRLVAGLLGPFADRDAQEVTQEVFLRAHQHLASFRGEARFSSWLYRLAYNYTLQHRRRARLRLPHVPIEELAARPASDGQLEAVAERERQRRVEGLLEGLPDIYRTVVYLHYWMDASVDEIAELIAVPSGTVKSYLSRARARLRQRACAAGIEGVE